MHPFAGLDWLMVAIPLVIVLLVGWKTQKYLKSVSDFTSGGRVAGRYLLSVATGEAGMGLISVVGLWELYYNSGFAVNFWSGIAALAGLVMGLTGYCAYRFRETRCLTMAQFLEVRYSRGVRLYSGWLSVASGIVNYAIFPAVGANFIMHYANLPTRTEFFGVGFSTYGLLLTASLAIAYTMIWFGGQLTIMCTDCTQGILGYWMYGIIFAAVLTLMSWEQIAFALITVPEPGQSMVNPFDILDKSDFNLYYVAIGVFGGILNRMSWQGSQGYFSAARNAHESKMAGLLGSWRGMFVGMMLVLLAIVGFTYLNHPDFAPYADGVRANLYDAVGNPAVRNQLLVPMALSDLLPAGVTGLMLASMILLMISTDNTYIHSWGTILFQDCILPHRKKPLPPRAHLMGLRMAGLFVAVFAWMFSYYFGQTTYILMFFALTGTIYLGGAGPCIVGGLYWKRGTTAAAYTSFTVGGLLGTLGMILSQPTMWQPIALCLRDRLGWAFLEPHMDRFPVNGQWLYFIAMVTALALYGVVSWITCREPCDLDRILHRGAYAVAGEGPKARLTLSWRSILGITDDFTRGDKALAWSVFLWSSTTWLILLGAIGYNLFIGPWADEAWGRYFFVMSLCVPAVIGACTAVWFTIGGARDLYRLFQSLKHLQRDIHDDGRVTAEQENAPEDTLETASENEVTSQPAGLRRPSRHFMAAAVSMVAALFLPWLSLPGLSLSDEAVDEAAFGIAAVADDGKNTADDSRDFPGAARRPVADLRSAGNAKIRYWGVELPWHAELPGRLDSHVAVRRADDARGQWKSARKKADALRRDRAERGERFAHLASQVRDVAPEAAEATLAVGGVPDFSSIADVGLATAVLREQWRWEASYLPPDPSMAELAPAARQRILASRLGAQKTRYAQALRHAGGTPPRDFNDATLDDLGERAPALLAVLWENELVRLEHAERKIDKHETELKYLRDRALRLRREADVVLRAPMRTFDMPPLWIYGGAVLALVALAFGAKGRVAVAYRIGLWSGLIGGASLLLAMLSFPETVGGCVSGGLLLNVLSAFLLVAFSSVALAGEGDDIRNSSVRRSSPRCPASANK